MIPAIEGGTASGWLPVRYIAAGVASRQAQVALRITLDLCFAQHMSRVRVTGTRENEASRRDRAKIQPIFTPSVVEPISAYCLDSFVAGRCRLTLPNW
ncbi:uncharacterized protein N7515_006960 [Penicillium bovifimosum]|uniref:Uncharacterized protein n=1 Tax=Penicillium bovifimosum TaxID=126998 RepID=A0A9W9GVX9_9EURO|nr:uncharacterized protein N7515_006960 [Penicillium bovifimosum]KAJ5130921.1 hypothetical protein N7515_006960 [Penicillium bovifimosum]